MPGWWDAIVVGAGPAGCLAAHRLARGGARVAVLEAESIPRAKVCGGGVVWRTWSRLPIAPESLEQLGCTRAEFTLVDTGFSHTVSSKVPIVTMTTRSELDAALAAGARGAGAEIRTRSPVRALRTHPGGLSVEAGAETLRARFVIGADGASGPTRRLAGWPRPLPRIPALQWEATLEAPRDAVPSPTARFFLSESGRGYSWVFPKRGHVSLGTLSTVPSAAALRRQLADVLGRAGLGELRGVRRAAFVIPTRPDREPLGRGRVLLCGDAAGLVDPITFEGIGNACTSGRLAAEALLASCFRPEEARERYAVAMAREVLGELRWARRFARLLYGPPRLRRPLFQLCGEELCDAMTSVVLGQARYGELVKSPRAHARLLTRSLRRALAP